MHVSEISNLHDVCDILAFVGWPTHVVPLDLVTAPLIYCRAEERSALSVRQCRILRVPIQGGLGVLDSESCLAFYFG